MACRKSLEKFLGKDYISKDGKHHFRALAIRKPTHPHDPFRFHVIEGCSYWSHVPLTNDNSSALTIKGLLKDMVEVTPASKILYYSKEALEGRRK